MSLSDFTTVAPGDVLLVDFGMSSVKCHTDGKRPAYVVSVDDPRAKDSRIMVIPAFRQPSLKKGDEDIFLRKSFCSGLRYDVYVNVTNVSKVERYRVIRKLGHMSDSDTIKAVREAFSVCVNGKGK